MKIPTRDETEQPYRSDGWRLDKNGIKNLMRGRTRCSETEARESRRSGTGRAGWPGMESDVDRRRPVPSSHCLTISIWRRRDVVSVSFDARVGWHGL